MEIQLVRIDCGLFEAATLVSKAEILSPLLVETIDVDACAGFWLGFVF